EATQWVKKVHDFFRDNDPHRRPSTASQSGGIYWNEGYEITDIPNVHLYETDWLSSYPGNPLRSSARLYYDVAQQIWNDFNKPGILGEAGYYNTFGGFDVPSPEYTQLYHNALWAGWAGGYATTPFWWAFGYKKIMSSDVMAQMAAFSKVAAKIDYTAHSFSPFNSSSGQIDVYGLKSEELTFGWAREINGNPVKYKFLTINELTAQDTVFGVEWFNAWSGERFMTEVMGTSGGDLFLQVPDDGNDNPDVAFIIKPVVYGDEPYRLSAVSVAKSIFCADTAPVPIFCYVKDSENRIVNSTIAVTFSLNGKGKLLEESPVITQKGIAKVSFQAQGEPGEAEIVASAEGLIGDTVKIYLEGKIRIDDFEEYANNLGLQSSWLVRGGTTANLSLDMSSFGEGGKSLRADYAIGNGNAYYAGFFKPLSNIYPGADVLSFWLKDDDSSRDLIIILKDTSGESWQYTTTLNHPDGAWLNIYLDEFSAGDSAKKLGSSDINEISFNIMAGKGGMGEGFFNLDAIFLQKSSLMKINRSNRPLKSFRLFPNYPNPFNNQTTIRFYVPSSSFVRGQVYDLSGRKVQTFLDAFLQPGTYSKVLKANSLSSGIYFIVLKTKNTKSAQKILLIK
ncbi:MAG: T9SS type A sorting domain-containing protein, partial [Calditrichaeota bacterium]|nr:T9SS type A sorting domain-containing protein [Calditrichota bacterium]